MRETTVMKDTVVTLNRLAYGWPRLLVEETMRRELR
ncbi:MAG: hypothetical protein UY70_C0015G0015, partial [Candidatus Kaiserbacteria bacterium GW2011_GWB1_52_6]